MASGITLTEIDPATLPTPDAGKDTIFMDATASPPAPAFIDSSGIVTSLIGPAGPQGPAGTTGSITTNPNGALDGDGSGGSPLGVRVDNVTIGINASNEIEALGGGGSGTVTNTGTLTSGKAILGNGGVDITESALTADLVGSAAGTPSGVTVRNGLVLAGGNLDVDVDNETIGFDSNNKLEVLKAVLISGGTGDAGNLTNIPVGSAKGGSVLPVANGGSGWTTVTAQFDQDVVSNTTVANDNELFFSMTAAKLYQFEFHILYVSTAGAGTPDFKYGFAGPATLTGNTVLHADYISTADANGVAADGRSFATTGNVGTAATPRLFTIEGWAYSTGGGAGSSGFILQWAQVTSGGNATTRLAGSYLKWRQVSP